MASEFIHAPVGAVLDQAEYEGITAHKFDLQATGDILYASSATQLSKLGIGTVNQLMTVVGGLPAWATTLAGAYTFSGSMNISGATGNTLVVDTNVLVVDATNNRVGFGTATPLPAAPVTVMGISDFNIMIGRSDLGNFGVIDCINNANSLRQPMQIRASSIGLHTDQFGGGVTVVGLGNATTIPASNPTGGGVLYAEAGALKWRGSAGTITTIALA